VHSGQTGLSTRYKPVSWTDEQRGLTSTEQMANGLACMHVRAGSWQVCSYRGGGRRSGGGRV